MQHHLKIAIVSNEEWTELVNYAGGKNVAGGRLKDKTVPFLDMNNNGTREKEEEIIEGLGVISQGGDFIENSPDSITRINGLELYTPHLLEFNESDFDNISWQLQDRKIKVYPDPNQFKQVMIPVLSVGEAYGMVFIRKNGQDKGQGRVRVKYYNDKNELIHETLSESDGYFTYFGLNPGKYYAALDTNQLKRANLTALKDSIPFEIEGSKIGDLVGDLNFILVPTQEHDTISNQPQEKADKPTGVAGSDPIHFESQILDRELMEPVEGHIEIINIASNRMLAYTMTDSDSAYFNFSLPSGNKHLVKIIAKDYMFFYETLVLNLTGFSTIL